MVHAVCFSSDDYLPGDPLPIKTKEEWTSVLKLSTAWEMEKVSAICTLCHVSPKAERNAGEEDVNQPSIQAPSAAN
jgi:hypothetical protein